MRRGVVLAVLLASCRTAPQIAPAPAPVKAEPCPELPAVVTSSAPKALEGVSKLDLYNHAVKAQGLAKKALARSKRRGKQRDKAEAQLGLALRLNAQQKVERDEALQRPGWWWVAGAGGAGVLVGVLLGFFGGR